MKINFWGAAKTVTGSLHLLEINGSRLLLECGMFQGRRKDTYERNLNFPFDPKTIDAVILSHAHIDHSGNLPNLVKQGYEGPIYCSAATKDLIELMLLDSGYIQEADAQYLNKKRRRQGLPLIEPIYTKRDADQVKWYTKPVDFYEEFEPVPGVRAELVENGHILGAAAVVLDIDEKGKRKTTRLWFSGDIGRYEQPLLPDPVMPDKVDYLMMECTYGDKSHHSHATAFDELSGVIRRIHAQWKNQRILTLRKARW